MRPRAKPKTGGIKMNQVILTGRLTKKPELRSIPNSGTAVTSFTLAVDKGLSKQKKAEMESKGQPTADFIRITVWGKQAENCVQFLDKGSLVGVSGRIQTGNHEKDGVKVFTTDVVANQVEFLEFMGGSKANVTPTPEMMTADDIPF